MKQAWEAMGEWRRECENEESLLKVNTQDTYTHTQGNMHFYTFSDFRQTVKSPRAVQYYLIPSWPQQNIPTKFYIPWRKMCKQMSVPWKINHTLSHIHTHTHAASAAAREHSRTSMTRIWREKDKIRVTEYFDLERFELSESIIRNFEL